MKHTQINNFESFIEFCKTKDFISVLIKKVENSVKKDFWRLYRDKRSFNDFIYESGDVRTNSVRISVVFGIIFEDIFVETLNHFKIPNNYMNDNKGDIKIFNKIFQIKSARDKDLKEELKASSNNYSVSGSTHCSSDCSNYIIFRYTIELNEKINKLKNVIKNFHFSIHNEILDKSFWVGKASSNNSITSLKIGKEHFDKFSKGLIFGEIKAPNKYIQFRTKNLKEILK